MVANILNWLADFFSNLTRSLNNFLSNLFGSLFQGLINVLKTIFKPILALLAIIMYFIYKLGELVVTLVTVVVAIGKLVFSFVMGIFNTIRNLIWTPSTVSHGSWSEPIENVFEALEVFQLDKIAYVFMFILWVSTAFAAIKILSGRGGASEDV